MTLYAGEQFRITATAKEYEGSALDNTNVDEVTISVFDGTGTALVNEATMLWDATESLWEYLWDTASMDPGSYRYRITVVGGDGKPSWEWGRVRLARNPFTA